ncbi:hypothetical protein CVT24_007196 [Panaeolus cyanescens]|uniref:Uncharacterized protein n=1 Tax=Panaeolus cyanescens TaxID=181874 RepID=A0A409VJL3_9AGAR|nr:hypothetical protein CVT24_007196 [Panaeolus cyanescens]
MYSSKPRPPTYIDAARILNDKDVVDNINEACNKLRLVMSNMLEKYDSISKQMHTIDLLRLHPPFKPRWDAFRKDLVDILRQFRNNSGVISGRLKCKRQVSCFAEEWGTDTSPPSSVFNTAVLPLAARNLDPRSGRTQHHEGLQVLQSYMTISAEHASLTQSQVEHFLSITTHFMAFLKEFSKVTTKHSPAGQKEMYDLSHRVFEFSNCIQSLLHSELQISSTDSVYVMFTSSRLVASSGRSGGRSKLTRQQIALDGGLANIGHAYSQMDAKQNELAHAQYSSQIRQSRTDHLGNAHTQLISFLVEYLMASESTLSLFLSIWSRLRTDCTEVFYWSKSGPSPSTTPNSIAFFMEGGLTLYTPLASGLDILASDGVDGAAPR